MPTKYDSWQGLPLLNANICPAMVLTSRGPGDQHIATTAHLFFPFRGSANWRNSKLGPTGVVKKPAGKPVS